MSIIDCPCINCICKPACRQKPYKVLLIQCSLARDFIMITDGALSNPMCRDEVRLRKLFEVLQPICWELYWILDYLSIRWTAEGVLRYVSKNN